MAGNKLSPPLPISGAIRSAGMLKPLCSNARRHASTCAPLVSTSVPSTSKIKASNAIIGPLDKLRKYFRFGQSPARVGQEENPIHIYTELYETSLQICPRC